MDGPQSARVSPSTNGGKLRMNVPIVLESNMGGFMPCKQLFFSLFSYPGAGDPELDNYEGMAYSCVMMLAQAYGQVFFLSHFGFVSKKSIPKTCARLVKGVS